jgi:hypothetical protein
MDATWMQHGCNMDATWMHSLFFQQIYEIAKVAA